MSCSCNAPRVPAMHEEIVQTEHGTLRQRTRAERCTGCGHVYVPNPGIPLTEDGAKRELLERRRR